MTGLAKCALLELPGDASLARAYTSFHMPGRVRHQPPPGRNTRTKHKTGLSSVSNPAEAGFWNKFKLTDKPQSFIESGVDSHSFHELKEAKTPPRQGSGRS
jgi:hypothetical protein